MTAQQLFALRGGRTPLIFKPMGKYFLLLAFGLGTALQASAQLSFSISPSPVQSVEVSDGADAYATITNLSTTTDTFLWQRQIIRFDDNGVCRLGLADPFSHYLFELTAQKTFWLHPGQSGPLYVELYDETGGCCALVHLRISKVGSPADTMTVVYHLRECQAVGTDDPASTPEVEVFPNPVQDIFSLKNAQDVRALRLFDAQGRLVERFEANENHTYPMSQLPDGVYFIAGEDKAGRVFQTLSVQKKQ